MVLSAKLSEMNSELGKLHSRIHRSDYLLPERLKEEIDLIGIEIKTQAQMLQKSMEESKIDISEPLAKEFCELKDSIGRALINLNTQIESCTDAEYKSERKLLFAEYGIDFAVLATKCALLISLEAMYEQKEQEERQEEVFK